MKVDMARAALVTLYVLLCSGCAMLSPVNVASNKYMLNSIPLDLPEEKNHSATLIVLTPETNPIYDTTQIAYTTEAHQIAYFGQNEWSATPSQMMLPLIVETTSNTRYFRQVVPAPDFGLHTFALRTAILEFNQDFTSAPAVLLLTMRFYLSREATNQLIASKEVKVREAMSERTPYAGVVAANEAATKILRELAKFVVEQAR